MIRTLIRNWLGISALEAGAGMHWNFTREFVLPKLNMAQAKATVAIEMLSEHIGEKKAKDLLN